MLPRVLITERLNEACVHWLAERAEVQWVDHADPAALAAALPEARGLVVRTYTQVDAALLAQAPQLKVVGRAGVGLDNFDLPACAEAGVVVVYTPDANTQAVVEYVLGLMLDDIRPRTALPADASAATFHAMRQTEVGRQLDEWTLGIWGFGRIGQRLGRVAAALGMPVLVHDVRPPAELAAEVAAYQLDNGAGGPYPYRFVDRATLLAHADVVSIHVDGRPENRHLLGAAALNQLRPGVMLINAARGMLIDHAALADWASRHGEARVVLDVHDPEPPPEDSLLHGLKNVRLLPHLASRTGTALQNMSWVVRDVAAVLAGDTPRYPALTC